MKRRTTHAFLTLLLLAATLPAMAQNDDVDVLLSEDLSTEESFNRFTVVNANDDSQTWVLGLQGTCIRRTSSIGHDDYLLTPELKFRRGRVYTLRYTAKCIVEGPEERIVVRIGKGTDPADYGIIVAAERGFSKKADETVEATFTMANDGIYRLALHNVTPQGKAQSFYVRDMVIETPMSPLAPQPASDLTVEPDADGALRATVSFCVPALARNGTALTALDSVEVWREEQLLTTIAHPQPGAQLSIVDAGEGMTTGGMTAYTVRAYNSEGRSAATVSAYVGEDYPKAPAAAMLRDDGEHVVVSWQAVDEGIRGYRVNTAKMTYNIEDAETGNLLAEKVHGTSYTLPAETVGEALKLHRYSVYAVTATGPGPGTMTNRIVSGRPQTLPLAESFASEQWMDSGLWWTSFEQSSWDEWQRHDDSSDGDGASLVAKPYSSNERMGLNTAKLTLAGTTNPCAVFSHKAVAGSYTRISLWADVLPQGNPQLLYAYNYSGEPAEGDAAAMASLATVTMYENGWQRVAVDLSNLKDLPYVVLMLVAENEASMSLAVDDIAIYDVPACDLAVDVALPKKTRTGKQTDVAVKVRNRGSQKVDSYRLELYAAGRLFHEEGPLSLQPYACQTLHVSRTALVTDPAQLQIEARLLCDADQDADNNSATATMRVEQTTLPTVDYLTGSETDSAVELQWDAPEQSVDYITEDFETYDAFATDLSPWSTIDGDQLPIFQLDGVSFPQNAQLMSFVVFNPEAAGWNAKDNPTTAPHSGSQYAASFAPDDWYATNDDWLVSPLLTAGEEQTVSFFARSVSSYYGDDGFDICYSTTGCDKDDFVYKANEALCEAVEGRWTEFFADLPAEARYFAIHYRQPGSVGLLIDDVTYLAPTPEPTGYNIYRDLQLIAHVDAATLTYKDTTAPNGRHTYYVTATYATGESDLSEPYAATVTTGVASVAGLSAPKGAAISDLQGRRVTGNGLRPGIYLRGGKKIIIQ